MGCSSSFSLSSQSWKVHLTTKLENISYSKSNPEHEYNEQPRCLSRKPSCFDPQSPHNVGVSKGKETAKGQKDWKQLEKVINWTASVSEFIPTSYPNVVAHHQYLVILQLSGIL